MEALSEARQLVADIATSLPESVDAASLSLGSKLPFKVISLRELLIHRVAALASPAISLFEGGHHVAAVVLTRALLETVALVFTLQRRLATYAEMFDGAALGEFVTNALLGSRSRDASHQANNVLTFVDHLNKEVTGFRSTYDALCEYAHPNWSGVLGSFGNVDAEKHILVLGASERTRVFAVGVAALAGSLHAFMLHYNAMVPYLRVLNERTEAERNGA